MGSFTPTVLAGPSGVGKGTILGRLRDVYPVVWLSVSATTRNPRPGEVDGREYHFLTDDQFDALIACDGLLEWAHYQSHRYGTPRAQVERKMAEGRAVIMELDVQGCRQVVERMPAVRTVFIAPPSWEELVRRLTSRKTESSEEIARRLDTARTEMDAQDEFDAVIVNDQVATAVEKLVNFLGLGPSQTSTHMKD